MITPRRLPSYFLLALAACGAPAAPDTAESSAALCVATLDWGCTADADCCDGNATCQANGVCRIPEGHACEHSESCAAGLFCVSGVCTAQCGAPGASTDDGAACCSGYLDEYGLCLFPGGHQCVATTDWGCTADADCCDGNATCQANGVCRVPEGHACEHSESCAAGLFCVNGACTAQCGAPGASTDDSAACCFEMIDAGGLCTFPGGGQCVATLDWGCSADADCCDEGAACQASGVCRVGLEGACTSTEQCAGGLYCVGGACRAQCGGAGASCRDGDACCSGVCTSLGTCSRPPVRRRP